MRTACEGSVRSSEYVFIFGTEAERVAC